MDVFPSPILWMIGALCEGRVEKCDDYASGVFPVIRLSPKNCEMIWSSNTDAGSVMLYSV